jgi:membrane-associated phospholipid phosphatase
MHWLQAIDNGLFHFINSSLTNPLFDWLMPVISGGNGVMGAFLAGVGILLAAAVIFGGARARLCAVIALVAVGINDGLVCNTIKHAVHRPRPCIALSDVVERLGCTTSGSMPSAHAANWFAATMIVFIFYRRKLWLMLPVAFMAVAVSFSRVYNGVHYPSDVLAGAIIGAGTAAAVAVALQTAWEYLGRWCFPIWHAQLPSLLNPQARDEEELEEGEPDDSHWLRVSGIFIVVTLVARWIYLASGATELSGDEAYQWLWSKHLALSYYSKPLGIALIQFVGTTLFGDNAFGVRFFSPLFGAILSGIALHFIAREIGGRVAFWFLVIVNTVPLLGVGSILMTIDPPLVLCWAWALVAGWWAVQPDGQTRDWVAVGAAMGLAFLCKYTAVYQIICFGIFIALWAPARVQLRKPGPWLALLIFLLCTVPVVIWNTQHGWITLHNVADKAGAHTPWKPTLRYFGEFVGDHLALLNPIYFVGATWAAFGFWAFRRERPLMLYLFCMSAPVFFGHMLYSFRERILPNWIAPAVPGMFLLMAVYWNERQREGARYVKPLMAVGVAVGFLMVILMYDSDLIGKIAGQPLPGAIDPMRRVRGWKTAAQIVEAERESLAMQGKPAFVIGDDYAIAGECTFYSPPARKAALLKLPLVYCVDSDTPQNQFYFWPEYNYRAARRGENAIYVVDIGPGKLEPGSMINWLHHEPVSVTPPPPSDPPARMVSEFEKVTDLGVREITYKDRVFHRVHLWACYNLK